MKIGAGFGILIIENNQILLGLRNSDPKKADSALHGEGTWTMPGGKIEDGETFEEGAIRELKEETNLDIDKKDIIIFSVQQDIKEDAFFTTVGMIGKRILGELKIMEPDEIVRWEWFDIDKIPSNLFPASARILKKYMEILDENCKKGIYYIK